jgi:hypothetical protein
MMDVNGRRVVQTAVAAIATVVLWAIVVHI